MQFHSTLKNIKSFENSINIANVENSQKMSKSNNAVDTNITSSSKSLDLPNAGDKDIAKHCVHPSIPPTDSSTTMKTDTTDTTVPTKNTSSPPLSLESGRSNLRKAIFNRSSSLTEKERSFLEEVLNSCTNVEILHTTKNRLQKNHPINNSVNRDEVRSFSSSASSLREAYEVQRIPSQNSVYSGNFHHNRLHPSISKRRKDLHKMLWDTHSVGVPPKALLYKISRSRSLGLPEIDESNKLQMSTKFSKPKLKRESSDPIPQTISADQLDTVLKDETQRSHLAPFDDKFSMEHRNWQNTRSISVLTDPDNEDFDTSDRKNSFEERRFSFDQTFNDEKLKNPNFDSIDDIDLSMSPSLVNEHNDPFPSLPAILSIEENSIIDEPASDKISSPLLLSPFNKKGFPQSNETKKNTKKKGRHRRWHSLPSYPTNDIVVATESLPTELDDSGTGFEIIHSPTSVQEFDLECPKLPLMKTKTSQPPPIQLPNDDFKPNDPKSLTPDLLTSSQLQSKSPFELKAKKQETDKNLKKHRRVKSMPIVGDQFIYVSSNKVNGDFIDGKILKQIATDRLEKITNKNIEEGKFNEDDVNSEASTTCRHPLLRSSLMDEVGLGQESMISREGSSVVSKIDNNLMSTDSIVSWEVDQVPEYSAWSALKDEYSYGYGHNSSLPFKILGTHADDMRCHPHVLSPPLMESLQNFLPESRMADNFWLKYSMIRDGASLHTLLRSIRGSHSTILAIETTDGQVFGSYTNTPWRKTWGYFGNGECFVWKMRKSRNTKCYSILEQARLETEIEVFTNSGNNDCYQACNDGMIAIGGNVSSSTTSDVTDESCSGFAIALTDDLAKGTTSPCSTFNSPCLTNSSAENGSVFEVLNVEAYSFTPFEKEGDAERNELMKMYIDDQSDLSMFNILIGSRKSSER